MKMESSSFFVDTHCHLDLYKNPTNIVEISTTKFIYTVAVTNAPWVFYFTKKVSRNSDYILPAIGFHPELISRNIARLHEMWPYIKDTKFVGEIGLDYSTIDENERKRQRIALSQILEKCDQLNNKILTVHSRRAEKDLIDAIGSSFSGKVILHWFSGPIKELKRAIEYGYYFSINSSMVNSENGKKIIARIPKERILTESDGPFVHLDNEIATPAAITYTVHRIASIVGNDFESTKVQIYNNFISLLK
jgi:TatD DNase family protein